MSTLEKETVSKDEEKGEEINETGQLNHHELEIERMYVSGRLRGDDRHVC